MSPHLWWAATATVTTAVALAPLVPRPVRVPGGRTEPQGTTRRVRRADEHHATTWAEALEAIAAEVRAGSSLSTAVERAAARQPGGDAAVALHTLGAAAVLGGPVASTLQHGALVLRDRHAAQAEAQAHSAQARLSATVLTVLPVAFTSVAIATSTSFRAAALSPLGLVALGLGAILNLIGRAWMSRLAAGSHR